MAIALDAVGSVNNATGTITLGHTVAGINTILVANFYVASTATIVASPSFAGSPLTKITSAAANSLNSEIWYLVNPPAGLGTLTGTASAANNMIVGLMSLTGVDQVTPITGSLAGSFTAAVNGSLAQTVGGNNWYVGGIGYNSATFGTTDATTGQISRIKHGITTNSLLIDTNTGAGTLRWTIPSANGQIVAAEITGILGGSGRRRRGYGS